jgi:hypothetical protein
MVSASASFAVNRVDAAMVWRWVVVTARLVGVTTGAVSVAEMDTGSLHVSRVRPASSVNEAWSRMEAPTFD